MQISTEQAMISPEELKQFKSSLRGELILPEDPEYHKARKIWNGMIDKRPAMIVRCAGVSDVIDSVKFARKNKLLVAVRGGGHNVAGNAMCDGGMCIDLSKMKSVRVDPITHSARAEPGVIWGEFDRETQQFALGVTGGLVSTTGIAGFTLGGGVGWLVRKYGLTCDNLLSVDLVKADGTLVTSSSTLNPDLFWGVRGGGGNFGIVTSFEFNLQPVGPLVLGGMVIEPLEKAKETLRFYREFVKNIPDELTTVAALITAPPAPFLPEIIHNKQVIAIAACYDGNMEEGEKVLKPLRTFSSTSVDMIQRMPYRVLQSFLDAAAPSGLQNYWKSEYLWELGDPVIDTIVEFASKVTSPLTQIHIHNLGGAMSRVPEDSTAFSHRDAQFILNIVTTWADPSESERHVRWARDFFSATQKFSKGGVYVNFLGEEGDERVRSAYGESKYGRLVLLKDRYDPTNFFHLNQNIKPSKSKA